VTVSLRRTLVLRFGLTMAAALALMALWIHAAIETAMRHELEQSLASTFQLQSYALNSLGVIAVRPAPVREGRFLRDVNRLIVVRDAAGRVLEANTGMAENLPLDTLCFRRARKGARVVCSADWPGGSVLALWGPVPAGTDGTAAVLEVAASTAPLQDASHDLLRRMVLTAVLAGIVTIAGAGWLAHSALRPVDAIATQAKAIQGEAPGERITAHADVTELQGLIAVLNDMLGRLDRVTTWHRRILRDLGHDLRTPIATIRAGTEVALWGERQPEEYRRVLKSNMEEVDRLGLIAEAVSLLGRLESGDLKPVFVETDLGVLVTAGVLRAREHVQGEMIRYTPPAALVRARVDARLLGLVLDQLLDNAMRHTPPDTPIAVELSGSDGGARLVVEDQGPGVPEELLSHLFDRFYRVDEARGRRGGPGLGLATVAAIVRLHQGRVAAGRGAVGGLRVVVDLPAISAIGAAA
jgi:signal transduction histidine kinase